MIDNNKLPTKLKVVAALIFWLLFLSVDILKKDIFSRSDNHYLYAFYFFGFFIWICLSFPLFSFFQRTQKLSPYLRLLVLLISGPLVGAIKVFTSWTAYYISYSLSLGVSINFLEFTMKQSSFHYVEASIISWIVFLLFFLSELYLKYRLKSVEAAELESKLYQSKLQSLKMQLQPHFLFNAHNTISMLIRTKMYEQAIDMTSKLSDLLRATLNSKTDYFISLEDEIELLKKYLAIELIRFEDTLAIDIVIDPDCKKIKIPNMILQPIIENAFKHGIAKHLGKAQIKIHTVRRNNYLKIRIYNTGPKVSDNVILKNSEGIGLKNVVNRLEQSYEDKYLFKLSNDKQGVNCIIEIPIGLE